VVVVLVVASGAAWESPLLALVGERHDLVLLKRCVDIDDLLASASAGQADAAVVALDAPGLDHAAVDLLHRHQVRVVVVAGPGSPDAVQTRAARIGVDGLVGADDLSRVVELLERDDEPLANAATALEPTLEATTSSGRVLVVWGPAGAPGRTTITCGVAAALASRGLPTTLVDADPYGGAVAQHLGVLDEVSGLLSVARAKADGGLERGFAGARRALGDHLTVVTGLPRPDRWLEVRPGVLEHLLTVARRHGHVVVDTGFSLEDDPAGDLMSRPGRNQLTLAALEGADEIVVVGSADPVGLSRLARGLVDLRDRVPGAPVRVVVNRMRPSLGWTERDIVGMVEGFARLAGVHFVLDDRAAADRALVSGTSVVDQAESDLARAVTEVAVALVPTATGERSGRRRKRRAPALSWRRADTSHRW
jgi:MinD-like ATPase involved in chromosome partitioning or flagellar assembly